VAVRCIVRKKGVQFLGIKHFLGGGDAHLRRGVSCVIRGNVTQPCQTD
jgi:hypothetical protein